MPQKFPEYVAGEADPGDRAPRFIIRLHRPRFIAQVNFGAGGDELLLTWKPLAPEEDWSGWSEEARHALLHVAAGYYSQTVKQPTAGDTPPVIKHDSRWTPPEYLLADHDRRAFIIRTATPMFMAEVEEDGIEYDIRRIAFLDAAYKNTDAARQAVLQARAFYRTYQEKS